MYATQMYEAPGKYRKSSLLLSLLGLIALLVFSPHVSGQQDAATGQIAEGFSSPDAIAGRLTTVRQELLSAQGDSIELLQQLESALLQHEEAVVYLGQVQLQSQTVQQQVGAWSGLTQQPPYSIRFADKLRIESQALQRQQLAIETRLRIINQVIEDSTAALDEHQRLQRQYQEMAELGSSPEERKQGARAAASEELKSRIVAEDIARIRVRRDSHDVLASILKDQIAHKQREIEAVRGKVDFSQAEFEQILADLERRHQALRAELFSGNDAVGQASGTGSDINSQISWKLEFLGLEKDFWTQLYAAFNEVGSTERAAAIDRMREIKLKADDWLEVISLQVRDLAETQNGAKMASIAPQDLAWVARVQEQVSYSIAELAGEGVKGTPLTTRLWSVLHSIWDLELYLAEETSSIGGQKVTTFRAVTLGKLLRLAFILVVGWFALRYFSRLVRHMVAKREGVSSETVNSASSWTFGLGLALLIIIALNRVHIPFTAFAFLGGTLAIGIGFGAQTLLKNFISGIILSFERPFRVGDLVQVEDIIGRIQKIGLRASVIRHFDGIDTLVPNSTLLENRVSNWTFGDTALRGRIEVGVAYGSPTRDVAKCLLSVAEEHGQVLDKPKPEVRFESFGDNTLVFTLLYWFDASTIQKDPLASDLRFMIDKAFADSGIVMAFPQRDLHFDDDKPLRIELSRPRKNQEKQKGQEKQESGD